ncbi:MULTISPECIES: A/G-specific adenine glycosylase [unclassified Acinetobacter]|uniref:A/G-specific adenine glycosylase n=1 Tax=unclassified Acinetobacter TaxID=196816 RepID=UPI0035B7F590
MSDSALCPPYPASASYFTSNLLTWYAEHGRHDLPWQVKDDPYQVWVSEIMLQQTQVKTVLNYFPRFVARFPTVQDLAQAEWDEVAPYWAGLGYYARARNLHKAAKQVVEQGDFPNDLTAWQALSGIGRSTAGALMSLGLGKFGVIMDGNVKRVLARYFAISQDLSKRDVEQQLWQLAEYLTPQQQHADYTQAIMDLGATICTPKKPLCLYCPMQQHCQAFLQGNVLDYPTKKIKKAVPTKTAHVLLLQLDNENNTLWYQRDSQGLWGGLYSLPMIEEQADFDEFMAKYQLQVQEHWQLAHHFTHFTWQLNVHRIVINRQQYQAILAEGQFADLALQTFSSSQLAELAVPTAMKKIMQHFDLNID